MKKKIFAILAIGVSTIIPSMSATATEAALYPDAGIVTEIDDSTDTVTVTMANGNMFAFYGTEDWCEGDIAALMMDDNGTEEVYDDIILDVQYAGTPEMLMETGRQ